MVSDSGFVGPDWLPHRKHRFRWVRDAWWNLWENKWCVCVCCVFVCLFVFPMGKSWGNHGKMTCKCWETMETPQQIMGIVCLVWFGLACWRYTSLCHVLVNVYQRMNSTGMTQIVTLWQLIVRSDANVLVRGTASLAFRQNQMSCVLSCLPFYNSLCFSLMVGIHPQSREKKKNKGFKLLILVKVSSHVC